MVEESKYVMQSDVRGHTVRFKLAIPEGWAQMCGNVLMPLLEPLVFFHKVQIIPTDNNGFLHLQFSDYTRQDTSTNAHIASKWAFFVNVSAFASLK